MAAQPGKTSRQDRTRWRRPGDAGVRSEVGGFGLGDAVLLRDFADRSLLILGSPPSPLTANLVPNASHAANRLVPSVGGQRGGVRDEEDAVYLSGKETLTKSTLREL